MSGKPKFRLEHVEAALRASGGIITLAAQKLAAGYTTCSPTTLRAYIKAHPSLRHVIDQVVEDNLDLTEGQLIKAIADGNLTACIFYLKTKGKHRGYVERTEQTGRDGGPIEHQTGALLIMPNNGRDPDITGLPGAVEDEEEEPTPA